MAGTDLRKGWSLPHTWQLRIRRDISAEEQGVPVPELALCPRVAVLARGVPITSGCDNQRALHLSKTGAAGGQAFLLRGPAQTSSSGLQGHTGRNWMDAHRGSPLQGRRCWPSPWILCHLRPASHRHAANLSAPSSWLRQAPPPGGVPRPRPTLLACPAGAAPSGLPVLWTSPDAPRGLQAVAGLSASCTSG